MVFEVTKFSQRWLITSIIGVYKCNYLLVRLHQLGIEVTKLLSGNGPSCCSQKVIPVSADLPSRGAAGHRWSGHWRLGGPPFQAILAATSVVHFLLESSMDIGRLLESAHSTAPLPTFRCLMRCHK